MEIQARNEVFVTGRLASRAGGARAAQRRRADQLAAGGRPRPRAGASCRRDAGDRPLDTLDCVAWAAGVQRSVASWAAGRRDRGRGCGPATVLAGAERRGRVALRDRGPQGQAGGQGRLSQVVRRRGGRG